MGAGLGKISQILKCTSDEAAEANSNFLSFYPGLKRLKEEVIPVDWASGYFKGFDGRFVKAPSEHKMLAGYLQNGEACIMKHANRKWRKDLDQAGINYKQVNFIHDEWQTEVDDNMELALYVAQVQADAIKWAGEQFGLNCPMAGSFKGDHGLNGYSIGYDWFMTH